ncbi:MAG: ABC transporter ATP-binding protein [Acidipropionibacterium sp.]|jgi:ABC-type multidrug transport system fused ATPase/permease subunit|nr:ABC transporter ATP-binding protein [Acidipropionibacterium sp.]
MSDADWRGVANEEAAEVSQRASGFLRARSRALLWDLLRPYKGLIWLLIAMVILENLSRLASPWLVRRGIDLGIPPLMAGGSARPLIETVAAMLVALVTQVITRIVFLRVSGRVGQDLLLELRRRVFRHFQSLDVAFHDRYTSGRVVSRMTNDIDAIAELMEQGFDGLVSALLTLVGTGIMLLVMDWRLGLVCLASLVFVGLLMRWFSSESSRTFRKVRNASAALIMHFTETMTGIKAVQAYRREPRNQEIFTGLADRYRAINVRSFRLFAIFMPGSP